MVSKDLVKLLDNNLLNLRKKQVTFREMRFINEGYNFVNGKPGVERPFWAKTLTDGSVMRVYEDGSRFLWVPGSHTITTMPNPNGKFVVYRTDFERSTSEILRWTKQPDGKFAWVEC